MLFPMLRRPSAFSNGHRAFFADFERMQRSLDRLFAGSVAVAPAGTPAIEFFKNDDGFVVRASVPGVTAEQLDISVLGKKLTIAGEFSDAQSGDENEEITALLHERRTGSFSRTLNLPQDIDTDQVTASFADGLVEIKLPLAASEQPRRIEIGNGS